MPRFYQYPAQPVQYNAVARIYGQGARAAETRSLGSLGSLGCLGSLGACGALGSRYLGPVPAEDLGPVPASLGKLKVYGYAGGQDLGYVSTFGGQNKDISLGGFLPELSDNEKRLVAIGAIGLVAWLVFGKKIKKGFKKK